MSLGIAIRGPEGIVLAAESRVTLQISDPNNPENSLPPAFFDNATKILSFSKPHNYVGVVTYGLATIGDRTAHSYLPELESELPDDRIPVKDFSAKLSEFFMKQWNNLKQKPDPGTGMFFIVAGFDDGEPYGSVYQFIVPNDPTPKLILDDFGISGGGQGEIMNRLLGGYDARLEDILQKANLTAEQTKYIKKELPKLQLQLPLNVLALQDCVNLALFIIRTTITAQTLTLGLRGVGGPIDVATIKRQEGLEYVQRKIIKGEKIET